MKTETIDDKRIAEDPYKMVGAFTPRALWKRYQYMRERKRLLRVRMHMRNSREIETFIIRTSKKTFIYDGMTYVIDETRGTYELGMLTLEYHIDCAIPFLVVVSEEKLRKDAKAEGLKIEAALNPASLVEFVKGELVQQIARGGDLVEMMRQVRLIVLIGFFIILGCFLAVFWRLGFFG